MARIAGIDLPKDKRVEIGLTYIYGIGRTSANKILKEAGINPDTRVKDLTEDEIPEVIRAAIFQEPEVQEVEEVNYTQTGRALDISFVGRLANGNTISAEVTMN